MAVSPKCSHFDDTASPDALGIEGGESPLALAVGAENLERYQQALGRLRAEEREAIIGRIEMGYTFQELADALGKPSADAARKATERALVRLAEEMSHGR
jgi:DNA-directed RNA polymerase specialized sigma24 family protein